jgi:hypothetical protein
VGRRSGIASGGELIEIGGEADMEAWAEPMIAAPSPLPGIKCAKSSKQRL